MEELVVQEDLGVANLISVSGIGAKAAAAVISEIGDIKQLETTKKLAGFNGAHPRFNDSRTRSDMPISARPEIKGYGAS